MANHKSALKRIRSDREKQLRNKYQHKTTRNAVRSLKALTDKKEAEKLLPSVVAKLQKLAKNNIIHKNKAANLQAKLTKHVTAL
jgi:small subunit ribosomal protein S20